MVKVFAKGSSFGVPPLAILVVFTVIVFFDTSKLGAFRVDDWIYLNPKSSLRAGLILSGILEMFRSIDSPYWHPATRLSFAFDFEFAGDHWGWFHWVNVTLHAGSVAGLGQLFYSIVGLRSAALAGSLFWALHPLRVESVAWLAERKDVLSGFSGSRLYLPIGPSLLVC